MSPSLARRSVIVALSLSSLGSCAPAPDRGLSAVPEPKDFLDRLRPGDLGRDVDAAQLITVSRKDAAYVTQLQLSVRKDHLILVAQDMLGQRLLTIRWTAGRIDEQHSPAMAGVVSPVGLLADLVAICWPEGDIRRALQETGSRLAVVGDERIVSRGGQETLRATLGWQPAGPWTGRMRYQNVLAGYSVDVQSVEQR